MKKVVFALTLGFLALVTCGLAQAETPTKESVALANARSVKRATPAPANTVKHLTGTKCTQRPLEQQGTGPRTLVTVCEM